MMDEDGEGELDLEDFQMKMFEIENPEKAKALKEKIKQKMLEIKDMINIELSEYFKRKELAKPAVSYIG
jgi:hypothetical protein